MISSNTTPGITISELNISNLNVPTFQISGITQGGTIRFNVSRFATCGTALNGKDTIIVNSSCGEFREEELNVYQIFSPSITLFPIEPLNELAIGDTIQRDLKITNAGSGCLDTLYFNIIYPGQIVKPINLSGAIYILGNPVLPFRINGDTLFFKLFGNLIFGSDSKFCSGEELEISESIQLLKCNAISYYSVFWGFQNQYCQINSASSVLNTIVGAVDIRATITTLSPSSLTGYCRQGKFTLNIQNNGSGSVAGTAYDLVANLGYGVGNTYTSLPLNSSVNLGTEKVIKIDSVIINNQKVLLTQSGSGPWVLDFSQFTSDPDGAGGLEDIDGDGQFDDLQPGGTVRLHWLESWQASTSCSNQYAFSQRVTTRYRTMCGVTATTNNLIINQPYYFFFLPSPLSVSMPNTFVDDRTEKLSFCVSGSFIPSGFRPYDTTLFKLIVPSGLKLVGLPNVKVGSINRGFSLIERYGNPTYDTIIIKTKGIGNGLCFEMDVKYNCGVSYNNVPVFVELIYKGDNVCDVDQRFNCVQRTISTNCPSCLIAGMYNQPGVQVERTSLGYTNDQLTTKTTPADLTATSKLTCLPLDTLVIRQSAIQNGGGFGNLFYNYQISKTSGQNLLEFIQGRLFYKRGSAIQSFLLSNPINIGNASVQSFLWDLTPYIPSSNTIAMDSVWVEMEYRITVANDGNLLGHNLQQAPGSKGYFYNLNAGAAPVYCELYEVNFYLVGVSRSVIGYIAANISGCNSQELIFEYRPLITLPLDIFPNEYRPFSQVKRVEYILPTGYSYDISRPATFFSGFWNSNGNSQSYPGVAIVPELKGDTVIFTNPMNGTWRLTDLNQNVFYNHHRIHFSVRPNCSVTADISRGKIKYYTNDYYYTQNNTFITPAVYSGAGDVLVYNIASKPEMTIQNNTGVVKGVSTQHFWEIQLNNRSANTAPFVWIGLDFEGRSGISIDSVVSLNGNGIVTLLPFDATNLWAHLSTSGILSGQSLRYRIYFKYLSCMEDSIKILYGWDCQSYPIGGPSKSKCFNTPLYLKVLPQLSKIELTIPQLHASGLGVIHCVEDTVVVEFNSVLAGNINRPYLEFQGPAGITIGTNALVEYPLNSGVYIPAPILNTGTSYRIELYTHPSLVQNGLLGTLNASSNFQRQLRIKIPYTISCNFISGTFFRIRGFGSNGCNSPSLSNGESIVTNGINVQGVSALGAAGINISASSDTISCLNSTIITTSIFPLIVDTKVGDSIWIQLPRSSIYKSGTFRSISNCTNCMVVQEGTSLLKIGIPSGIPVGSVIRFTIEIEAPFEGCENSRATATYRRLTNTAYCLGIPCSSTTSIVGSANSNAIRIDKPILELIQGRVVGSLLPGQTVSAQLQILNTGKSSNTTQPYLIEYSCGGGNIHFFFSNRND
ncbi:MAG: hypothetical protein MUE33_10415 [Cytophagaceae bacterium]|nr:hypothetical protein [Cytophagaceae bacterium]